MVSTVTGEWERSLGEWTAGYTDGEAVRDEEAAAEGMMGVGYCHLHGGRMEEARRALDEAIARSAGGVGAIGVSPGFATVALTGADAFAGAREGDENGLSSRRRRTLARRRKMRRVLVLRIIAAVPVFSCLLGRGPALADACDTPPPPRFQPGQNDHYPHGADVITCTKPAPGREAWHIEFPSVDRSLTDYTAIRLNPGDVVRLSASGCVQTGGWGSTWKRYVDPDDGNGHLDSQYYGTVQIAGVTGDNNPQTLKHWIGPSFVVPAAGHFALGYVDDGGIGDNGYWNHDDGVNNQCAGVYKAVVDLVIDRGATPSCRDCGPWTASSKTPVAPDVPELARVVTLLRSQAEVPFGLPMTPDAHDAAITHFQIFQDGSPDGKTTLSNRPLNSAEMHADGCIYLAFTPTEAPIWYPADLAFDKSPQRDWQARPWDLPLSGVGFVDLQALNRDPASWRPTFLPGFCGGAGTSWRSSAPRWIKVCAPRRVPPAEWTAGNLAGFPTADPPGAGIGQSGAICKWEIKHAPDTSDGCIHWDDPEWTVVRDHAFLSAQGLVTNSFLSGGDWSGDHNGMPDGRYIGVHTDVMTHNDAVQNCPDLSTADNGQQCADWEINLLPDADFRHLLARDESMLHDRDGGDCQSKHSEYRQGNQVADLRGALGVEGEQWYYPVGFRPEPGDRAVVRGLWIIDCGHPDWHAELHPASLLESSYLQTADYAPVLGATWNRPLRLTGNWRALTGGAPAVVTKIVASPVFAERSLEIDVWPPARPCPAARLKTAREAEQADPRWSGVQITETLLPADGNPNHLHLTIKRKPFTLNYGGDGDVQNPDSRLTFFTAYMAWWSVDKEACGRPNVRPTPDEQGGDPR